MLHHVEIYVSDLEESRKFYSYFFPLMNYELYQEWECGFSYKYGETYIVFVQAEPDYLESSYHRKNIGLNHLAFSLNSEIEIDNIRNILLEYGVQELYTEKYPYAGGRNYYAFFFEDPDRIKLEITIRKP